MRTTTARLLRTVDEPGRSVDGLAPHRSLAPHLPPGTVFSHHSAAFMWGLASPAGPELEVTTASSGRASREVSGVQRHRVTAHRSRLPGGDRTTVAGLPVTTLPRTWLDLAANFDLPDIVAVGDSALARGADRPALRRQVMQARGRRGCARARMCLDLLDDRSRSRPESRMRAGLLLAGLPAPEVNRAITDDHGGWIAEPDLVYRAARLALEYYGGDHAESRRMRRDARRVLSMQRAGWEVRVYTAADVFAHLDDLVDEVRAILQRRAPQLLTPAVLLVGARTKPRKSA